MAARYNFGSGSPPNFSYHILDTDFILVIPQFQQMVVCNVLCMRAGSEIELGVEAEIALI